MTARHLAVFMYGLFMDASVLRERKALPVNPRRAYADDFALRIGRRALLVPSRGARAYGVVFGLTQGDLDLLYSEAGLEEYRPEAVLAQVLEGDAIPALCYNLPEAPPPEEQNPEYAARLRGVLTELDFPEDYVASVG